MRRPTATYRLQFRAGMDFDAAIAIVPYLRDLGVSHLYASPIFTAVGGSTHGYDVIDHNAIDPALGGREGFDRLCDALRMAGLGLVLDIVPNHMAASLENHWWRSVVEWGEQSPFARHFDIDWSRKLTLPLLGRPLDAAIEAGELVLGLDADAGGLVLRYFDNAFPLHPASWEEVLSPLESPLASGLVECAARSAPEDDAALHEAVRRLARLPEAEGLAGELAARSADRAYLEFVLGEQPWELLFWKEARRTLSYRRFFEVTGLVGVRVEDDAVFDEVHRLALELVRAGRVDGLRIDHVDGLADPTAYLRRLRREAGPEAYIVVEKILAEGEAPPAAWPVDGTTGYEFIGAVANVLANEDGVAALRRHYRAATGSDDTATLARAAKLQVLKENFEGELAALASLFRAAIPELGEKRAQEALARFLAAMPVYRIYTVAGVPPPEELAVLAAARDEALRETAEPDSAGLRLVHDLLAGAHPAADGADGRKARLRFQQLAGPAMAKGIEDTFFYRDHAFIALNEVGGDPRHPPLSPEHFHRDMAERRQNAAAALSATATHDTKRGEDARARLYVLSEMPDEWAERIAEWCARHVAHVRSIGGRPAPEPGTEWLIYQALVGMWPASSAGADPSTVPSLRERFLPFLEKALREAKLRTSWTAIDAEYEKAVLAYADALFGDADFLADIDRFVARLGAAGIVNGLTQTLLKLTAPGIPDVYQGAEASDFSLVDPDNRRPVDFVGLAARLRNADGGDQDFPSRKLRLTARLLAARRDHPDLFAQGDYVRLATTGRRSDHVVAFARRHGTLALVVAVPRRTLGLIEAGRMPAASWERTAVEMPPWLVGRRLRSLIGRQKVEVMPSTPATALFGDPDTDHFAGLAEA